ncbi:hypothetical protein AURDEDRAFT_170100 [Auricularia subglabra TFB-10046 SS5]|uniref:RNI-like protein n=1 Tax=Auricularia subglabra (strain TFB-10046 / SS5) TaxID=717982 RepID=J0D2D3_AURST|nr:hypothetical protein AURDEDRAFT_170100 [Auricularia subglabra TFB-10046 SS5]
MRCCSYQLNVLFDRSAVTLEFLSNNPSVAQITTRLAIYGQAKPNKCDDETFVALVACCPNLRALHLRRWNFTSVRPHLLSQCSFLTLTSFFIGAQSMLTVAGFFGLLAVMPALKRLGLGRVEGGYDSDSGSGEERPDEEKFATPACSLTHLVVSDDWNIGFWHYGHLLSRSHDTLEHLELHWIFDDSVGDAVADALARCTRVRHLTLIGNDFANERIIAACPTVCSLELVVPPSDAEAAAMRAPLRSLELVNCYVNDPESFIDAAWERLRERLPMAPALSMIGFRLMRTRRSGARETEGLRKLRKACKERRILLSFHG